MAQVIVLGFDAMDPRLVERWMAEGHLPNMARLRREGAGGKLRSTIQPLSPTAWSTAVTGMNPGKHGVFDWYERDPQHYHGQIVSSSSIKAPTLWERVNQAGLTAGVLNVPLTFPPKPLDGWLVTDILTPPGARQITYPASLRDELDKASGGYRVFFGVTYQEGEEQTFLDALHDTLERRRKALLHLIQSHPTDLIFAVFMESDHIMHYFWKYMDVAHPSHRPEHRRFENAIRDVYHHLDAVLGDVMALLQPETTLFVMSDHGSGPLHGVLYINKLLMQNGLLTMRRGLLTLLKLWLARNRIPERAYALTRALGLDLRPLVPKHMRQLAINAGVNASDIDWQRTLAYVSGDFGQISVNLAGREKEGQVDPRDKEVILDRIVTLLQNLTDENGQPLVDQTWRAPSLYHGPYLDSAPDLLFCMRDYQYQSVLGLGLSAPGVLDRGRFGRTETSGGHALYGILYVTGPGIRPGTEIADMDLTQLAPTVLYRLGLPVPSQMDGRVIEALFEPEHLSAFPIRYIDEGESSANALGEREDYSAEEAAQIETRLRDLGYLE